VSSTLMTSGDSVGLTDQLQETKPSMTYNVQNCNWHCVFAAMKSLKLWCYTSQIIKLHHHTTYVACRCNDTDGVAWSVSQSVCLSQS